jgi:cob(I)alamin adenosyltransferase
MAPAHLHIARRLCRLALRNVTRVLAGEPAETPVPAR